MSNDIPEQAATDDDFDQELALIFLTSYHSLQQALVRAGFRKAGRRPGSVQPDWEQFARHIAGRFRPESSPELLGAVSYLLLLPGKPELRRERLEDTYLGEPATPQSDLLWLSELVQEIGNKLTHGINFTGKPGCEMTDIVAALFVVEAWSYIDPQVESLLAHVH